jgi:hypothetical protein
MNFNEQLEQLYNTFKQVVEEKNELVIKNQELEIELENANKKLEASKTFELQNWSLLKQSSKNDDIIDLQEISNFLKFIQHKAKFFDESIRSNTKNSSHIDIKYNQEYVVIMIYFCFFKLIFILKLKFSKSSNIRSYFNIFMGCKQ